MFCIPVYQNRTLALYGRNVLGCFLDIVINNKYKGTVSLGKSVDKLSDLVFSTTKLTDQMDELFTWLKFTLNVNYVFQYTCIYSNLLQ